MKKNITLLTLSTELNVILFLMYKKWNTFYNDNYSDSVIYVDVTTTHIYFSLYEVYYYTWCVYKRVYVWIDILLLLFRVLHVLVLSRLEPSKNFIDLEDVIFIWLPVIYMYISYLLMNRIHLKLWWLFIRNIFT